MKRMISAALVALCVMATVEQRASAYSKFNFGIGLNIGWECANNNVLFGLFKSGPGPCGTDGCYGDHYGLNGGHASGASFGAPAVAQTGTPAPGISGVSNPQAPLPVQPMPSATQQMPKADAQPVGYWTTTPQYYYGNGYYPYQPMWYGYGFGYYGY